MLANIMDMVHVQQQENGDLENQKCQNICSCFYLIIYRILLKLKFRKQICFKKCLGDFRAWCSSTVSQSTNKITRQHILMIYIFPNLICVSVVEIRSCSPRTTDIWLVVIAWSYIYFYINIRILIRMSCFAFMQTCNASFCECKHNLKGNISVIACDPLAFL